MKIMKRYIQVIFICWLSINSITEVYGKDPIGISLVKWSFRTQTAILCDMAKENGAVAIDMVDPEKWDIVKEKGLTVAMAFARHCAPGCEGCVPGQGHSVRGTAQAGGSP